MRTKWITNDTMIDLDNSIVVLTNGFTDDRKREIWLELSTDAVWIETNGNPEVYETLCDALNNL